MQKDRKAVALTIKRHKVNTYLETDEIFNERGQKIGQQQNLNVRNRYGAKEYKYNGKLYIILKWERI